MTKHFRIHGDNIVECERLYGLIAKSIQIKREEYFFLSPACPSIVVTTVDSDTFIFKYFPGFNKNTSDRWTSNIFQIFKDNGSILNETPDVLLTEETTEGEQILIAIEFCSALQAGNQAWQRSGRAYSSARANLCPYLYIIDFVKYELDANRNRKALRFPNAAIPYSYCNASKYWQYPAIQVYFKSEEFQPEFDALLQTFDTSLFGEQDVSALLYGLIYNKDVTPIYSALLKKSLKVLDFMAATNRTNSYSQQDWESIHNDYSGNILAFSKQHKQFPFTKKIAQKSISGHNKDVALLASQYSIGIASKDLPFGLIPSCHRIDFADGLYSLYPEMDRDFYHALAVENDLIVCMFKGFKPHGDDARPDRGILPFITMLTSETAEILTFIYGETSVATLKKLDKNILSLANENGLWNSIVSLSDFIILDAPLIPKTDGAQNIIRIIQNKANKLAALAQNSNPSNMLVSPIPTHYTENDVDTFLHIIFHHIIPHTFEGFCNPPGGDWSGISLIDSLNPFYGTEFRWLTLPRVSKESKRPDHVTVLFGLKKQPLIICTESKESAKNLEPGIGPALENYMKDLLSYPPSVERKLTSGTWTISSSPVNALNFCFASIGCFLAPASFNLSSISGKCNCDVLIGFDITPSSNRCRIQMKGFSEIGDELTKYLTTTIQNNILPINIFDVV